MKYTRVFLFLLWIFWMGFIFYLSNIPDLKSFLPSWQDFIFRKIAHIFEYAVLWILTERVFYKVGARHVVPLQKTIGIFLFTILFAISDEIHQSFVEGRYFTVTDILIDILGMVLGYITRVRFL